MLYKQKYDKAKYTYYELIKELDVIVPIIKQRELEEYSTAELMKLSLENALKEGGKKANDKENSNSYYIDDKYGNIVRVSREGLTHSKRRKINARRNLIANFSTIFKKAVKVNEAYRNGRYSSIYFSEYYFGTIPYIARFIIINDNINDVDVFSLYSLGTNKKEINASASMSQELISTISVKQLLNDVNKVEGYKDSLPLNVLHKINGNSYRIEFVDIQGLKY